MEKDGQSFPDGARRAESISAPAVPVIVHPTQVIASCPFFQGVPSGKVR